MVYIEKNDKPNFFEKLFCCCKVINDTIIITIDENMNKKKLEKIAIKTTNIISKISNSRKVVLSRNLKKNEEYFNYLNTLGIKISDGSFLFELLLKNIVEYIIQKKQIEKVNITFLINDLSNIAIYNILELSDKYKNIGIVTNHSNKFKKIQEMLEDEGKMIVLSNNKKRSLSKSNIILNIDFPKELLNKYNINDDAVIVNFKEKISVNKKRFNGSCVYDYMIDYRDDEKFDKAFGGKYDLKDLYEAKLYEKQDVKKIMQTIMTDNVSIKALILNNGLL